MELLTNISQLSLYLLVVFIVYHLKIIPSWIALYFAIFSTSPFWFNDLLFSPTYMPDQFRYLWAIVSIREFDTPPQGALTVYIASLILSLIPIPFVINLFGVAFINKMILLILFLWLYNKKLLYGFSLYFVLLYPDLILYSSLALRDILIMTFMIVGSIFLINKKYLTSFIIFTPLFFIKFQNFAIMMILYFSYIFLIRKKLTNRQLKIRFGVFIIFISIVLYLFAPIIIEPLEFYRRAMFFEDGGDANLYKPIQTLSNLLFLASVGSLYFLLKPSIFEITNTLQLLQSIVNIAVFGFLAWVTTMAYKKDGGKTLFYLLFFLLSMSIYSIVIANPGTAVRYKFPFVVLYVILLNIEIFGKNINARVLK